MMFNKFRIQKHHFFLSKSLNMIYAFHYVIENCLAIEVYLNLRISYVYYLINPSTVRWRSIIPFRSFPVINEPCCEKTVFLHMRKQRRRSAAR